ncbi:MAG TPA: proteasome subunit beta [Streptosporangiaceae bacterium]|nr:proteasome subunit beta [Streptosporangiaceae bacterium]
MAAAYLSAGTSSFSEFLRSAAPELLRGAGGVTASGSVARDVPHGTTIVAASFNGGVVMAGDRRATAGNMIAQRDIEKVFRSDEFSCIGIAGAAGIGIDLVRLFQVELEHYEKLEGRALSLEGKANRLAGMVRANLGAAMQGFVVVPLFAGYDTEEGVGRIFSYDPTGGRYEEQRFYSIGSGSVFARGALKKLYTDGMDSAAAIMVCMQALYDAADDDAATGGPDLARRIWPIVLTVTADGYQRLTEEESGSYAEAVINERLSQPDGPTSPVRPPAGTSE